VNSIEPYRKRCEKNDLRNILLQPKIIRCGVQWLWKKIKLDMSNISDEAKRERLIIKR